MDDATLPVCPMVVNCVAAVLVAVSELSAVMYRADPGCVPGYLNSGERARERVLILRPGKDRCRNGCRVLDEKIRLSPDGICACQKYDQAIVTV